MSSSLGQLGYGFAPVPIRAFQALRDGRLSSDEFVLIVYLYSRAQWRALRDGRVCVECTLDQLAEGIASSDLPDTLSKRLRRLREKPDGWFHYTVQGRNRYRFRLFPHAPELSEISPSSSGDRNTHSGEATHGARPRSMPERPSSAEARSGSEEPDGAESGEPHVRDPQTYQKDTNATSEGWTSDAPLELDDEIRLLPEIREAIRAHRARHAGDTGESKSGEERQPLPHDPEADEEWERITAKFPDLRGDVAQ